MKIYKAVVGGALLSLAAIGAVLSGCASADAAKCPASNESCPRKFIPITDVSWEFTNAGGGGTAIVSRASVDLGDKREDGLHIVLRKTTTNKVDKLTVRYKIDPPIDMYEDYRVLDFTFRTSVAIPKFDFSTMHYRNAEGVEQRHHLNFAKTPDASKPEIRKYHEDMQRNPSWVFIADTSSVTEIRFVFDLSKLPVDELTLDIGRLCAVAENTWKDMPDRDKKWLAWIDWIKTWEPDYSDSSKYLEPPLTGRIAEPLSLTIGGKANAEIVCNNDESDIVMTAAKELQHWLKKISGAELPIVDAPGEMPVKIFLNPADGKKRFKKDLKYLKPDGKDFKGDDGFYVRTKGSNIYIGGLTPKGVQNGVFRFLENNTDIIWMDYNPNYGTVYSPNPDVKILWADAVMKPRTKYRGTQSGPEIYKMRNLGRDRTMRTKEYGGAFFNDGLLESYLTHDEFAAYVGDPEKGYQYRKTAYYVAQACLREEAFIHTRDEMLAKIKKDRENGKNYMILNCGIEDNWAVCCCEHCTKPITLPDGTVLTSIKRSERFKMPAEEQRYRSNQYWDFINRLAIAIREVYPEMYVGALDYFYAEMPPDIPLEKNIFHIYCPLYPSRGDYKNPIFSPSNKTVWRYANGMVKKGGIMDLYEYYFYFPIAETVKQDFIQYLELGWQGLGWEHSMDRTRGTLGLGAAQDYWCMYRLMWDPYRYDVMQLRKYFIRRVYHEGAPVIEKLTFAMLKEIYKGVSYHHPHAWPYNAVIDKEGDQILAMFKEYLPKIKAPIARMNYVRMMTDFEDRYNARKNQVKKDEDPEAKKLRIAKEGFVKSFYGAWGENYASEYGAAETILTDGDKPMRAVRIQFNDGEQYKKHHTFQASSGIPSVKESIPITGKISFKLQTVQAGVTNAPLPEIYLDARVDNKWIKLPATLTSIGEDIYNVEIPLPEGGIARNSITSFKIRFRKNQFAVENSIAEFIGTDLKVEVVGAPAPATSK